MKRVLFTSIMIIVFLVGSAGATEPVKLKFHSFAPFVGLHSRRYFILYYCAGKKLSGASGKTKKMEL